MLWSEKKEKHFSKYKDAIWTKMKQIIEKKFF